MNTGFGRARLVFLALLLILAFIVPVPAQASIADWLCSLIVCQIDCRTRAGAQASREGDFIYGLATGMASCDTGLDAIILKVKVQPPGGTAEADCTQCASVGTNTGWWASYYKPVQGEPAACVRGFAFAEYVDGSAQANPHDSDFTPQGVCVL